MKLKVGDEVSVLDDSFTGRVKSIKGDKVNIETPEGFLLEFGSHELVKISAADDMKSVFSNRSPQSILKEKEEPKKRSFIKEKKSRRDEFVLEVDLHIEKLVPNKKGMSNYDILTLQTETAKRQLEFAIKNRMPKVVFIHGVGEGVLKAELDFLLGRYEGITFQDANYQKYGLGATEVYIKQNPNR
ncbi:DNA mismatch repair protein MutS [Flavobacterium cyanobacteriorum]|uniref:DNA mismatch repair protein MutS n=1 Tax=Flavobacterium cyanobacteriorum TaxID=2022802 RepID=A0A255ZS28_9FLAO|nr:Smr/MutS family protein [Flavobacterium cyanobacteriorum]OYQ44367.1 DNA mismatch repair protein MutS [Flavobacterium cyanobacteriorum]